MNYKRLVIASVAATVVYFAIGGIVFTLTPLRNEFRAYPALYRPMEAMQPLMPIGVLSMFVGMVAIVTLFAMTSQRGAMAGTKFGALIGIFVVCGFVIHNYVNLNIGLRITLLQAIAYLIEWILVGLVIGLICKPSSAS